MTANPPTSIVNVDFWAGRIAALIKLAEHYGMTVEITGGELAVSRQVSDVFVAQTEVQWRAAPPDVSPAVSVTTPPTAQTGLRDLIAQALYERERPPRDPAWPDAYAADREVFEPMADAVLAVLPPPADRAAVLREIEQRMRDYARATCHPEFRAAYSAMANDLERLAFETPEPETGDDLIEEYLRFLRGQGPEPDLSDLTEEQREALTGQFEIVKALAALDPELPPLDRDPVARRLGLHTPAAEAPEPATQTEAWDVPDSRPGTTDHTLTQAVQHAPGKAILCPDCRAKGYSVCMADEPHPTEADLRHALAVAAKFHSQTAAAPTAYGDGMGRAFCLKCAPAADVDVPLTANDVGPGELCPSCGRDIIDVAHAAASAVGQTDEEASR